MKVVGIIPARYNSTRFPGKPLVVIKKKPMIQHVYEQAKRTDKLDEIIVATDDSRIKETVKNFGGKAMMTKSYHTSGTERCAEILDLLKVAGNLFDVVINIQGDEPFINPKQIDLVISCFENDGVQIATLAKKIDDEKELFDKNVVKVVSNINGIAIYFSRQTIPYIRGQRAENWLQLSKHYKHIGIYGYQSAVLEKIVNLPKTYLEEAESLEQLRWIENGYTIKVKETDIDCFGVDVPEDLSKFSN